MADLKLKRKMLFAERMIYNDGTTPFNGVFPIRIKGTLSEEQIRHAMKRLQEKHPALACSVNCDQQGEPWIVSPQQGGEASLRIVDRTADGMWMEETVKEWSLVFDAQKGPLMRMVWIRGDALSELLLVVHHCIGDGGSGITLVRELLLVLDQPGADIGVEKTFLQLEDIVPAHILRSRRKRFRARMLAGIAHFLLHAIPLKKKEISRGSDYILSWKLSEEDTKSIIHICKTSGVTVNTAMSVALLKAFVAVKGKKAFNKMTCPVNIRQYASGIKKDTVFGFGLMIMLSLDRKPGGDFWSCAKKMQQQTKKKLAGLNAADAIMLFERSYAALPRMLDFLRYKKAANDSMLSNIGLLNIPHEYQRFTVDTLFSPSVVGPFGNPTALITSIFRRQLDFSFVSSEGYLPYNEAMAIKTVFTDILLQLKPAD